MDLNKLLYENETVETGDIGAAADEPIVEEAGTAEVEIPAAPALNPLEVQAELEQLRSQNQQMAELVQQAFNAQQPTTQAGFEAAGLDPFADDFPAQLAAFQQQNNQQMLGQIGEMIQGIAAPLAARQEQETVAEGEARLADMLADDIARNGEFSTNPDADKEARALVRTLANHQFPDIAARYGHTPRAAEIAMARAADQIRQLLKTAGTQAATEQANRVATLAGVRGEPGNGAAGIATLGAVPASGSELARKYGSRAANLGHAA